jgi:beta-lactam-binding protein with PASTA domain
MLIICIPIFLIASFVNWIGSFGSLEMPDLKGKSVSSVQSILKDSGFSSDKIHIKSAFEGEKADSDWQICKQSIAPKEDTPKKSEIELLAAPKCSQLDKDNKVVDSKVPALSDLALDKARELIKTDLGSLVKVTEEDVTPSKRSVWDAENWIVCSQNPAAGSLIAPDSKIDLTYGRDKNECSTKQETLSESAKKSIEKANKATATGLTEYGAQDPCDNWLWTNYGTKSKAHWIVDKRFSDVVDEGYGEMWQFNVGVTLANKTEGVLICKVTGTDASPVLVEAFINQR